MGEDIVFRQQQPAAYQVPFAQKSADWLLAYEQKWQMNGEHVEETWNTTW